MKCFLPRNTLASEKPTMSNINNNNFQIDFGLLPKNIPSLCIPRVFSNITEARIRKTFEDIFIGRIEKIDIIKKEKFNCVFVHLSWNNNTSDALYVRNQVMTGKDVKIIYEKDWFWMVSASRIQTPSQPQQLSHKTDEFGRELRTQEEPLIKPILQRQRACFQPPPPPPPPGPPPMQLQMQRQRQDHRPPQQHKQPPIQKQRQDHRHQEQKQQLTDEFGRELRRQPLQPPQPPQPPSSHRPSPPKQEQKSWASYDHQADTDDDESEELHKPVFIPQSPTSTPPPPMHKQIKVQEEEEPAAKAQSLTRSTDVDQPKQIDMIQVKYDVVLPLNKIRGNNKKSKK